MPSGRTNYRRLPDYAADMKQLAEDHPGLVRPITLPYLTIEGRPVEGIEITRNPDALDGKPVFVQLGLHHAREWPSGELALEWAYELVQQLRSGPAHHRARQPNADDRGPGRQPGRLQSHPRGPLREPDPDPEHGTDRLGTAGGPTEALPTSRRAAGGVQAQEQQHGLRATPATASQPSFEPRPSSASTRTATTARFWGGPGRAPTRPATPSGVRSRSRSPRAGT